MNSPENHQIIVSNQVSEPIRFVTRIHGVPPLLHQVPVEVQTIHHVTTVNTQVVPPKVKICEKVSIDGKREGNPIPIDVPVARETDNSDSAIPEIKFGGGYGRHTKRAREGDFNHSYLKRIDSKFKPHIVENKQNLDEYRNDPMSCQLI